MCLKPQNAPPAPRNFTKREVFLYQHYNTTCVSARKSFLYIYIFLKTFSGKILVDNVISQLGIEYVALGPTRMVQLSILKVKLINSNESFRPMLNDS